MTELSEAGAAFLAVMMSAPVSHPRFRGTPLDVNELTPRDLGRLLPTSIKVRKAWDDEQPPSPVAALYEGGGQPLPASVVAALDIIRHSFGYATVAAEALLPQFDVEDALEMLRLPAEQLQQASGSNFPVVVLSVLAGCEQLIPGLPDLLLPLLPDPASIPDDGREVGTLWETRPHGWIYLAHLCGKPEAQRLAARLREVSKAAPLVLAELELIPCLDAKEALALSRIAATWAQPLSDADLEPLGAYALALVPAYMAFAERSLRSALQRVERIHTGEVPYGADKAFVPAEGQVIGRCARAALDQDAPWLGEILGPLWLKTSLAPTVAKTMPSQSVAIALGRAVEEKPNAAALTAMREVASAVRHAAVKKKLTHMLKTAERRLADRPDFLMQLDPAEPIPKSLHGAVRRSYEYLHCHRAEFEVDTWRKRFMTHKDIRGMTERLIWRVTRDGHAPFSGLPVAGKKDIRWILADGGTAPLVAGQSIALWHPLDVGVGERDGWRDRVMQDRIEQPFLQAYRQFYVPQPAEIDRAETAILAGHKVSIRQVMGVARSQGWALEHGIGFAMTSGDFVFHADFGGSPVPGSDYECTTGPLRAYRCGPDRKRIEPALLSTIDPVLLSEIIRRYDLLASVGAISHDPHELAATSNARRRKEGFVGFAGIYFPPDPVVVPVGYSAAIRREVLRRLYASREDVTVASRYIGIGEHQIHIGTARVTRRGEPVELDLVEATQGVVWLPHDDAVLERIVRAIAALAICAGA